MNSPELDGKYLGTITSDFVKIAKFLQESSYQLRVRKISEFPIFVLAKKELNIGQILLTQKQHKTAWDYHFTFLENLSSLKIITEENITLFKENYKNPEEFACLLVLDEENNFLNFVYLPYPEDEENEVDVF
jgi:hypothetical protein